MNLPSLIQDDTGAVSSMRVGFLLVLVCLLGVWTYISISTGTFADMPEWCWNLLALAFGSKAVQSLGENLTPAKPTTP